MTFADLFSKLKLSQGDSEVIFDRDEPIGAVTDLVMPRRHWFRRGAQTRDDAVLTPQQTIATNNNARAS
jgi:hypothetical protein